MRYYGHSNNEIIEATRLSKTSIVNHVNLWNSYGMKSVKDNRGGSESKLEPEMVDNLIYVVVNKTPLDFEFTAHTWTCELLSLYIEQTFGVKVSGQTIRVTLCSNNISYKRSQPKPTKADEKEQEAFKKISETLDTLESSSDVVVYALDETKVSVESNNRLSWSPVGNPPVLEKNASHDGVNIIGSTSILNEFHTVNDVYSSEHSITSEEVKVHLEHLIEINEGNKIVVFMDNAKFHTSNLMQSFFYDKKSVLKVILLPRYSPNMNPQENIWNYIKSKLFKPSARKSIFELTSDIRMVFDELNCNPNKIRSLAYARSFLV